MAAIDLTPFGYPLEVSLRNDINRQWLGGSGLVILFGESHGDREMIGNNIIDCCALINTGIVVCVGVEDCVCGPQSTLSAQVEQAFRDLAHGHHSDEYLITHLRASSQRFRFGEMLHFLRPSLPLSCVDDADLHKKACQIEAAFTNIPENVQDKQRYAEFLEYWLNHPIQHERESKMVNNVFMLWDSAGGKTSGAAILNTGSVHSERIADRIRAAETSFVYLAQPR